MFALELVWSNIKSGKKEIKIVSCLLKIVCEILITTIRFLKSSHTYWFVFFLDRLLISNRLFLRLRSHFNKIVCSFKSYKVIRSEALLEFKMKVYRKPVKFLSLKQKFQIFFQNYNIFSFLCYISTYLQTIEVKYYF